MTNAITSMAGVYDLINQIIRSFDASVLRYLAEVRAPFLTSFFFAITNFADFLVGTLVIVIAAIILRAAGNHRDTIPLVACVGGAALTSELLKLLFARSRPLDPVYFEPTFSFPSTHSAVALALYGFLALIALKRMKNKAAALAAASGLFALAVLVGFSRLYLGVHFASDIIGGFLIAGLWLIFCLKLDKSLQKRDY